MNLREYAQDLDARWLAHLRETQPQRNLDLDQVQRTFRACQIVFGNFPGIENVDLLGKMAGAFVDDESLNPEQLADVVTAWSRASGKSVFALACEGVS